MTRDVSRALALLLTVALMVLAWIAVVEPAIVWKRQALRDAARAEASYLRLINGVAALEQDHQTIQSAPLEDVIWRPTEGRALILDVQSALADLAQDTGVTFSAVSPAQSQRDMGAETVALALELRAPLDAVLSFVKAVEDHEPPLIIESATLRRTQRSDFDTNLPVLQTTFRITAVTLAQNPQVTR